MSACRQLHRLLVSLLRLFPFHRLTQHLQHQRVLLLIQSWFHLRPRLGRLARFFPSCVFPSFCVVREHHYSIQRGITVRACWVGEKQRCLFLRRDNTKTGGLKTRLLLTALRWMRSRSKDGSPQAPSIYAVLQQVVSWKYLFRGEDWRVH